MTPAEALAFVCAHGVVLESATGPVPSLAAAICGGPVRGSWWAHPRGREIFAINRMVRDCADVLVCRLVDGKITYVHRRLWPAVVRLAKRLPRAHLARIHEMHTALGKHVVEEIGFPHWVSAEVTERASLLDEADAASQLGPWRSTPEPNSRKRRSR